MKTYLLVVVAVVLTVVELGWLAPALISAKSTELLLFGVVSLVVYFPVMYYIVRGIISNIKPKKDEKESANV